jgi:hypothetical protein
MTWMDKEGNPIDALTWGRLHEDESYMRIGSDSLLGNSIWVSTVWLGINHNFSRQGPPILFETMVFAKHGMMIDLYCQRYSTEDEAKEGHAFTVMVMSDPDWLLAQTRTIDDGRARHGMVTQARAYRKQVMKRAAALAH